MTIKIKKKIIHSSPQLDTIMLKLSELAGAVGALNAKADGINNKLDAFLPGVTDPALPPAAEQGITDLSGKLDSIAAKIPDAPPAVV